MSDRRGSEKTRAEVSIGYHARQVADLDDDWRRRAACSGHDTDLWFSGKESEIQAAKKVCSTCPVCRECLEYGISSQTQNNCNGIWGGMQPYELLRIRRWRQRHNGRNPPDMNI